MKPPGNARSNTRKCRPVEMIGSEVKGIVVDHDDYPQRNGSSHPISSASAALPPPSLLPRRQGLLRRKRTRSKTAHLIKRTNALYDYIVTNFILYRVIVARRRAASRTPLIRPVRPGGGRLHGSSFPASASAMKPCGMDSVRAIVLRRRAKMTGPSPESKNCFASGRDQWACVNRQAPDTHTHYHYQQRVDKSSAPSTSGECGGRVRALRTAPTTTSSISTSRALGVGEIPSRCRDARGTLRLLPQGRPPGCHRGLEMLDGTLDGLPLSLANKHQWCRLRAHQQLLPRPATRRYGGPTSLATRRRPSARASESLTWPWKQHFVEDLPVGSLLFEGQGRCQSDIWKMDSARARPVNGIKRSRAYARPAHRG
jgi:hypothetical protein